MSDRIKLTGEHGERLYNVFVFLLHKELGGPKEQRTPTTDACQRIADLMQNTDGEQLCYELCREYLSNALAAVKGGEQ